MARFTQGIMNNICSYIGDEVREQIREELSPCTPEEFLSRHLELDPSFSELLQNELSYIKS